MCKYVNIGGIEVKELKYTNDGYLIVSELYKYPLWEKSLEAFKNK